MPRKSGFFKEGNWPKTVLSRVPPVLPSLTSKRVVISAHVKPPVICAAKNSFRRLTSSENGISASDLSDANERLWKHTDVVNINKLLTPRLPNSPGTAFGLV